MFQGYKVPFVGGKDTKSNKQKSFEKEKSPWQVNGQSVQCTKVDGNKHEIKSYTI